MPRLHDRPLNSVEPGETYVLSRVNTHEADKLQYLGTLGLKPGVRFALTARAPFNGPLQLKMGEEYRIIGHNLAELIKVQPADQP